MQKFWSWQLLVMVIFSCSAFTANKLGNIFLPDNGDLVSAFGALIIGLLGNFYSRIIRGTAFTSMVTGVLFLVPVRGRTAICASRSLNLSYSLASRREEASSTVTRARRTSTRQAFH